MKIIYITHNGIGTPLVRSQVLPYLRRISEHGVTTDLVTFERMGPVSDPEAFPRERWYPLQAVPGSDLVAKALDIVRGVVLVVRLLIRGGALVHARSYVPAAIAWAAATLLRRRYVFDMRGFLPEEYVEGGYWTKADPRYRLLKLAEGRLLRDAAAIVVLTRRAAERLRREPDYSRVVGAKPVVVIPCAVDLDRFRPAMRDDRPTVVYAGSLGLWYELDAMLAVFAVARSDMPALRFLILNLGQREQALRAAAAAGVAQQVEVRGALFDEMPALLARAHVGICLLRPTSSKLGSSPIKVAEYLACGLPVVVNVGQGDLDSLVERSGAGHVMRDTSRSEIERAGHAVASLVADERARGAARKLAESEYSADRAAEEYLRIYRGIRASRRA